MRAEIIIEQITRIEALTEKCLSMDEYKRSFYRMNINDIEFKEVCDRVIDNYDFKSFPPPAFFHKMLGQIKKDKEEKNEKKQLKNAISKTTEYIAKISALPITPELDLQENHAFIKLLNECRIWHKFRLPCIFDGSNAKLKPLEYKDFAQLLIIADIGKWLAANMPPLPSPVIQFWIINSIKIYRNSLIVKDHALTLYFNEAHDLMLNKRKEISPESFIRDDFDFGIKDLIGEV